MGRWFGFAATLIVFALIVFALSFGALPAQADSAPFTLNAPLKIAMIQYNQRSDGGWTRSFEAARTQMEKDLNLKIDYYNNVDSDRAHIIAAAERLISQGNNVIIGTGFDYSEPFVYLANLHPHVAFLNGGGVTNGPNLQSFYGRSQDSQYLCGMVAGAMSKTGKVGFVAAFDLPTVNLSINGFTLGVRQSRPDAAVDVRFTNTWADPGMEEAVALRLIDAGADVIGQNVDTPRPQVIAQARGIFATGHHRDLTRFAPKATLCSSVWIWTRYLTPTIKAIAAGTWKPDPDGALPPFKDGPSDIVLNKALLPQALIDRVMAERQAIIDGKDIFAGNIRTDTGRKVVAEGSRLTDVELNTMMWHVEGVVMPELGATPK